jgi:hypothetical protein
MRRRVGERGVGVLDYVKVKCGGRTRAIMVTGMGRYEVEWRWSRNVRRGADTDRFQSLDLLPQSVP